MIHANSSLTCMGRPGLGMLRASNWKDVSTYEPWKNPRGADIRGEDPMLWVAPNSAGATPKEVLHCVTHGGGTFLFLF